jgi:UDP-4-amino-4,6-dideoxy-N-acetyl-beta-L-altrosamine N-acetyltransferase
VLKLIGKNIVLKRLTVEDIELVRNWRNTPEVAHMMEFKQHISSEEQYAWFKQLNPDEDYYFIIRYQHEKIGLIHLNKYCSTQTSAHAGLFIGNKKYVGTGATIEASILLLDLAFHQLKLTCVYAKMNKQHHTAAQYNKLLGFNFHSSVNNQFDLYVLTAQNYLDNQAKLKRFIF